MTVQGSCFRFDDSAMFAKLHMRAAEIGRGGILADLNDAAVNPPSRSEACYVYNIAQTTAVMT